MVMKQLYINGVGTGQFDIYISSDTFLNSPEIAYEAYEVPSLDGSLLKYDKRLNNVARRFDCFCKTDVDNNIAQFKKLLYSQRGYIRIESDYDPDYYQMGYLAEGIEFEPFDQSGAYEVKFSVYFSCKPTKIYKTTSTLTVNGALSGAVRKIYSRSDPFIQNLFAQLPISSVPSAEYYGLLSQQYAPSFGMGVEFTATLLKTGDPCFMGLVRMHKQYSSQEYTYTLEGSGVTTILSIRNLAKEETFETWYTITELNSDVITTRFASGDDTITNTRDLGSSGHGEVSVPTAMGANIQLTSTLYVSLDAPTYLKITGKMTGKETFSSVWTFDKVAAEEYGLDEILATYGTASGNATLLDLRFDLETYDIYAVKGSDEAIVTNLFTIEGNMEGFCDEIKVAIYTAQDGSMFKTVNITPDWWTI
jgi:hypothetical protein